MDPKIQTREARSRLDKWSPDTVLDAATQIRALMAQPGWLKLQELAEDTVKQREVKLFGPRIHDQAMYARLTGEIAGLRALMSMSEAVFEQARLIVQARESRADAPAERTG